MIRTSFDFERLRLLSLAIVMPFVHAGVSEVGIEEADDAYSVSANIDRDVDGDLDLITRGDTRTGACGALGTVLTRGKEGWRAGCYGDPGQSDEVRSSFHCDRGGLFLFDLSVSCFAIPACVVTLLLDSRRHWVNGLLLTLRGQATHWKYIIGAASIQSMSVM